MRYPPYMLNESSNYSSPQPASHQSSSQSASPQNRYGYIIIYAMQDILYTICGNHLTILLYDSVPKLALKLKLPSSFPVWVWFCLYKVYIVYHLLFLCWIMQFAGFCFCNILDWWPLQKFGMRGRCQVSKLLHTILQHRLVLWSFTKQVPGGSQTPKHLEEPCSHQGNQLFQQSQKNMKVCNWNSQEREWIIIKAAGDCKTRSLPDSTTPKPSGIITGHMLNVKRMEQVVSQNKVVKICRQMAKDKFGNYLHHRYILYLDKNLL